MRAIRPDESRNLAQGLAGGGAAASAAALQLPKLAKVIPTNRPIGADFNHMVWETLTHGDIGAVGLPPVLNGAAK